MKNDENEKTQPYCYLTETKESLFLELLHQIQAVPGKKYEDNDQNLAKKKSAFEIQL